MNLINNSLENENYRLLTGALRIFGNFSYSDYNNYVIEYDHKHMDYQLLIERYNLHKIAGNETDLEKSINIMRWVSNNVLHNGNNNDIENIKCDALSILNYSFGKGIEFGLICRHQAIVFTECCLSIGLKAKTIHCLPFSPYDFESHVVSMVYLKELNKWGMFDPTNNAYFMNDKGIVLSPIEARYYLSIDRIEINNDIKKNTDYYKRYMAKNLFYIKYWAINTLGTDLIDNQKTYYLIPFGFNVKEREICYCQYAIENTSGTNKNSWKRELEKLKFSDINIVSEMQFLK